MDRRKRQAHASMGPARLTAVGFLALIVLGTLLLMLPFSAVGDTWTPFMPALFTATSAVSLTGLVVEDTATYWTGFGQFIIIVLIQFGGLGIMSLAALSGMFLTGRVSFRTRQEAAAEGRPIEGGIRKTLQFTVVFTLACEAFFAIILAARLHFGHHVPGPRAVWEGIFHAISAFNNAGFSTYSDNVISFAADAWILLPLAAALIVGGLGYPVWGELLRTRKIRSITARMTLRTSAFLLVLGMILLALTEWSGLLEDMPLPQKMLNAFFLSASPRTAGFNAIDYGDAHPITLMISDALMFIGGGSAGTAGGVKVTTACVLAAAMAAEFLGREDASIAKRRLPHGVMRQALALTAAGVMVVACGVAALRVFDPQYTADQVTFEVMSAFATVGLSTGITSSLSAPSQITLCLIMYLGRVGPTTLVAALAAHNHIRHYSFPEERPTIG